MSDKGEYSTALGVLLFFFSLGTNENFTETFTPSQVRVMSTRERVSFKHRTDEKCNSGRKTIRMIVKPKN